MNLGDAFSRRKELDKEIEKWINRLTLAGKDTYLYNTKEIEGRNPLIPIIGTQKNYKRNYTIKEVQDKISNLIEEDKELALRISKTNQVANAKVIDLDGVEREYSIPSLLVIRNEITPKLERAVQSIPRKTQGVEIIENNDNHIKYRKIRPVIKNKQEFNDKGLKLQYDYIDYYQIEEVTDYGKPERQVYDEIDKIHDYLMRIKIAINEANKAELIKL